MSARFGLRIGRRLPRASNATRAQREKFWADLRELSARLRAAPGSQAVINARRRARVDPVERRPPRRRRPDVKPKSFDRLTYLKAIVATIPERVVGKSIQRKVPRKIRRAIACLEAGVPNTGRQWRKLRKQGRGGPR